MACERWRGKVWCALFLQPWPWESSLISGLLFTGTTASCPSCLHVSSMACLLELLTCLDCSYSHTHTRMRVCTHSCAHPHSCFPGREVGNQYQMCTCTVGWMCWMLTRLCSPHNTAAPFLQSGHLWLGDSEAVLYFQPGLHWTESHTSLPGWILSLAGCGKSPTSSKKVC